MTLDPLVGSTNAVGAAIDRPSVAARQGSADGADFRKFLLENLNKVNAMQQESQDAVQKLQTGEEQDITKVMSAVDKANVAFQTLMAVRNKLMDSYDSIMQMRV